MGGKGVSVLSGIAGFENFLRIYCIRLCSRIRGSECCRIRFESQYRHTFRNRGQSAMGIDKLHRVRQTFETGY